jgi:glutaredoxin-related protein
MVWDKSNTKGVYPLLFVNDNFVGDYATVQDLNEVGQLADKLH